MQDLEKINLLDGSFYDYHYYDDPEALVGYKGYSEASINPTLVDLAMVLFQPKSCLDLGCAKGYYVKAFRDRGVNAWGVDFSKYAIENAPEEISRYLFCMDALKFCEDRPFRVGMPSKKVKFSLIFMQDLLEHLPIINGGKLIEKMIGVGENVFTCFAALPEIDDPRREQFEEEWQNAPEHVNMVAWNVWEEIFKDSHIPYFVIYTLRFGHWDKDTIVYRSSFPLNSEIFGPAWDAFLATLPG